MKSYRVMSVNTVVQLYCLIFLNKYKKDSVGYEINISTMRFLNIMLFFDV